MGFFRLWFHVPLGASWGSMFSSHGRLEVDFQASDSDAARLRGEGPLGPDQPEPLAILEHFRQLGGSVAPIFLGGRSSAFPLPFLFPFWHPPQKKITRRRVSCPFLRGGGGGFCPCGIPIMIQEHTKKKRGTVEKKTPYNHASKGKRTGGGPPTIGYKLYPSLTWFTHEVDNPKQKPRLKLLSHGNGSWT